MASFFLDFKLFLSNVVLDVIMPSILRSNDKSTIFFMSLSFKSGEILIRIGLVSLFLFSLIKGNNISRKSFIF